METPEVAGEGRGVGSGMGRVDAADVSWSTPSLEGIEWVAVGERVIWTREVWGRIAGVGAPAPFAVFGTTALCAECRREEPCDCGSPARCKCTCGDCLRDLPVAPTFVHEWPATPEEAFEEAASDSILSTWSWPPEIPVTPEEEHEWAEFERRLARP